MQLELLDSRNERKEWWERLLRQLDLQSNQRFDLYDPGFLLQLAAATGLFDDLVRGRDKRLHTICITAGASLPEDTSAVWTGSSLVSGAILALQVAACCERLLEQLPARIRLGSACQLALEKSLGNIEGLVRYAAPHAPQRQNKLIRIATQPLMRLVCRTSPRKKAA